MLAVLFLFARTFTTSCFPAPLSNHKIYQFTENWSWHPHVYILGVCCWDFWVVGLLCSALFFEVATLWKKKTHNFLSWQSGTYSSASFEDFFFCSPGFPVFNLATIKAVPFQNSPLLMRGVGHLGCFLSCAQEWVYSRKAVCRSVVQLPGNLLKPSEIGSSHCPIPVLLGATAWLL